MQQTITRHQVLTTTTKLPAVTSNGHVVAGSAPVVADWGRRRCSSWVQGAICLVFMTFCPILVTFIWITLEHFDGSIFAALTTLAESPEGFLATASRYLPQWDRKVTLAYAGWILFQAALYTFLPGTIGDGQRTPAGYKLEYKLNGLLAWIVTIATTAIASAAGWIDPATLAKKWENMICTLNLFGLLVSLAFYVKARIYPSHARDRKFSGSVFYDLYMGIELNPRIGKTWDMKTFQNGHLGMISWTVVNLSFVALQYQRFGYITNSMIVVNVLQALYVADLCINEHWYLHTIDICHDHFGFYFAWGSGVFLPTTYTLQSQYLARRPIQRNPLKDLAILLTGLSGYAIFRIVNHQKHIFRRTKGNCKIWGATPKYINCVYKTADGSVHKNMLLCSGAWGVVRHANYVGDLILSYSMCAVCGFNSLIPWSYAIFMTLILVHRCHRDEKRCLNKYGESWRKYCEVVRWKLVPGIY